MIRWLVVGAGRAGQCHLAAIARIPEAELAGIVTLDPPPAGVAPVYRELTRALAETTPDAVILATPHATHLPLALAIIDRGLPLLCEKPAGRNADDARRILAAGARQDVPVGVVLNQRGAAHHRWIRRLITDGELKPLAVTFQGALGRLSGWNMDPEQAGGGVLRSIGLHYLDLLRWWLGEPHALAAVTGGGAAEDRAVVSMRFANAAIGSLQLTALGATSTGPVTCLIEAPPVRIMLSGHVISHLEGLPEPPPAEPADPALMFGPGHLTVVAQATEALLANRELPISLADALPSLELVDRAYALANQAAASS